MTETVPILWYPITPEHPPRLERRGELVVRRAPAVWLDWDGRKPFLASRVPDPNNKRRERWAVKDGKNEFLLPTSLPAPDPRRPWAGWHTLSRDGPSAWRPQDLERWTLPLPEPIRIQSADAPTPRLWSSTQRFSEVTDAEWDELIAENKREQRYLAGDIGRDAAEPPEEPDQQWWTNPFLVTYSQPGQITEREAEGRLMRAFATERWVKVERPGVKTFGGILARLAATVPLSSAELAAMDPEPILDEPTGRDWDDMPVALAWLQGLNRPVSGRRNDLRPDDEALRLRALQPARSWRQIGKALGCSAEGARKRYASALVQVTQAANGASTDGTKATSAAINAVRDGNRKARLR